MDFPYAGGTRQKIFKILSVIGLVLLCWTFGYFGKSVHAWFGEVWIRLSIRDWMRLHFWRLIFAEDAAAIRWLKEEY